MLIPKFTPIAKRAKFILEHLAKMIVEDGMIIQEKDVLIKMLYNLEVVLACDFFEIGKVKRKITSQQKI